MRPPFEGESEGESDGEREGKRGRGPDEGGSRAVETIEMVESTPKSGLSAGFPRSSRLLEARDFRRVLRSGRRAAHPELVVVVAPRGEVPTRRRRDAPRPGSPRLGLTVSRKAGPSVARNRFKRRVRDWFRHHGPELGGDVDIVVIARAEGIDLAGAALSARLGGLVARASGRGDRSGKPGRSRRPGKGSR